MSFVLGQNPPTLRPPFPAWKQHYVVCVERALKLGLQQVQGKKNTVEIQAADERHITYWLYEELLDLIQGNAVDGFSREVFEIPHLDPPTANANNSSIQKMPDLRFHLTSSQSVGQKIEPLNQYAWFCECKLVQEKHSSRTYANYQAQGVQRFMDGQYAWAMPHAQMIAYVRWPSASAATPLGPCYTALASTSMKRDCDVCVTKHPRNHQINAQPATPIELRHIWFKFQ